MASREEKLQAENARLTSEMSAMKKKIAHALKKQQAELQAKILAAEQRARAAEEAVPCNSSSTSDEATSSLGCNADTSETGGALLVEKLVSEKEQLTLELGKLRETLEDQRNLLEDCNLKHQREIEVQNQANVSLEAQLVSAAQQVSEAFSRISEMHEKLDSLSRERDSINRSHEELTAQNEIISKQLEEAKQTVLLKEQELTRVLASHKSAQEGQDAATADSDGVSPIKNAETAGDDDGRKALLQKIIDQEEALQSLRKRLEGSKAFLQKNEELNAEISKMRSMNTTENMVELSKYKDLEQRFSALAEEAQSLAEEEANLRRTLESEIKSRDEKYAELDQRFNKLQKRAKQRIQEVQKEKEEIEARLTSAADKENQALAKQSTLQSDLERFRVQAGDAIRALDSQRQNLWNANAKLKEELEEMKRELDSKEHILAESRRLASEKDQAALSMQAQMEALETKHAADLTEIHEKHSKAESDLKDHLNDASMEKNMLAEVIASLQAQLSEKETRLANAEASLSGEVARLSSAVESAKLELLRTVEEQENERAKWKTEFATLVARIRELEHCCQQLELSSSEAEGRWQLERKDNERTLSAAQRAAQAAEDETERVKHEFHAYKQRAHALLQKKDIDLQAARDTDLLAAQEALVKEAQREAVLAKLERDKAVNSLKEAITDYETQLAARNVAVVDAEQRIKDQAIKLESTKALLATEREEWQRHLQELDASWREKYAEIVRKGQKASPDETELSMLRLECQQIKVDYRSYREMVGKMVEDKDQQITKLLENNNRLQLSQVPEVKQETSTSREAVPEQEDPPSVVAVAEQQILLLARQQAQREAELKQCQRQIDVLQEEISDLERENRLHRQQEAMLKEELRNVERSIKRNGVDMTYLKNVILKLLETGEAEALLPVVGMLLQFSPDEVKRCQDAYANANADAAATPKSLLSRLTFGSSNLK